MSPFFIGEVLSFAREANSRGHERFPVVVPRSARRGSGFSRRMVVCNKPRLYGEVASEIVSGRTIVYVNVREAFDWVVRATMEARK